MTASIAASADRLDEAIVESAEADARDHRAGARRHPRGHLRPGEGGRPRPRHPPGRRPRPPRRRARPRQDEARRDARHRARARRAPRAVHAGPDALRHSRLRDPRRGAPTGAAPSASCKGPIFAQLLMADEINRASPRTQSALLQAMQEHHVSVGRRAPRPAAALPRAGDPEPDRAGGHLSAARGAARPLPARRSTSAIRTATAERRILIETTGADEQPARGRHDRRGR